MIPPEHPLDELARLEALRATGLLDSPPEERFDRLTRLARQFLGVPIALVSLVDEARQWFKSRQGLDDCETGRDISFCGHAILDGAIFEVPDASLDPRFADNPLVTGPLGLRFYAGAPLVADGHRVGTLCVIDRRPRQLDADQAVALRELADCVQEEIGRIAAQQLQAELALSSERSTSILHGLSDLALVVDREGRCIDCNEHPDLYLPRAAVLGQRLADIMPPALLGRVLDALAHASATREQVLVTYHLDVPGGAADFEARFQRLDDEQTLIIIRNISREKATQAELQRQHRLSDMIARAQLRFIREEDRRRAFGDLLDDVLALTTSEYGFIGEVLHGADGAPYLKTYAITDIAWDETSRAFYAAEAPQGMEFYALRTLFGAAMVTAEPVIANDPKHDPRRGGLPSGHPPLNAFLGLPIVHAGETVAMIGLANRPGGYDAPLVEFLQPLLITLGQLVVTARIQEQHRQDQLALERFKGTVDRALDCVFMFDTDELRCFYGNEGALRQIGYSRDELLCMHPWDIAPGLTPQRCRERLSPLGRGQSEAMTFESALRHRNGALLPVEVLLQYIAPENEPPRIVAIVRDISQRKLAESERARVTTLLTNVLAAASEMSIIATDPEGIVTLFNGGAERMLGYSATEMIGHKSPSIFHLPAEMQARGAELTAKLGRPVSGFRILVEALEHVGSDAREWTYVHRDGRQFPVSLVVTAIRSSEGALVGYLGIGQDITERKQTETMLREQAEHTRAIVDNMVDGVVAIDELGTVVSFNFAAERIFGVRADDVVGKNVNMLMPSPHREAHDGYLHRFVERGEAHVIGLRRELEGQRADGSLFPMELAVSQVTRMGQPMYVGMIRDITDRRRDERMKREFVSTVSHELRTPLTCIAGALGLITGGALGELPSAANEMLDVAYENSKRLTDLINDLLDMEKITAGKMNFDFRVQPLRPIVEHALEVNRAYGTGRGVTLALVEQEPDIHVRVDSLRLNQVLSNLLSNAIKFSNEGGEVEVAILCDAARVSISVRDHGKGIPAAFRDRVFQKFAQADASDTRALGGTGLGLAITRELLERMDGRVGFDSIEGAGATFTFDLPIWEAPAVVEELVEEHISAPEGALARRATRSTRRAS